MYEALTVLIPSLMTNEYGEWIIDRESAGTPEQPIQFPFVHYGDVVSKLIHEIHEFTEQHPEYDLCRYADILNESGIEWGSDSMRKADVSKLDGRTVMALLTGIIRAERFCDGILLRFCKDGTVIRWLERLREIDAS